MKILIVGAGPTGLVTALEMARRGYMPTIIDKRQAASNLSRAVGITPKSLELLSASGVDKALIEKGVPIAESHIFIEDKHYITIPFHSENSYFPNLLGLPQDQTEQVLIQALGALNCFVQYNTELVALKQHVEHVDVHLSTNEVQRFDYVVGADGVHSKVRHSANIDYKGYDLNETWSIADVNAKDWPYAKGFSLFQLKDGKMLIVVAIGDNRYRIVSNTIDSIKNLPISMHISHINRQANFNISVRQAESYSKGRVHLVGDAAHSHSPVGGRGMNMGIGDACELAKRLDEGGIEEYSQNRHAEGHRVIPMTEKGRKMIASKSTVKRLLFKSLLIIMKIMPFLKKRIGRFAVEF